MSIQTIIIDDEPLARVELKTLLKKYEKIDVIAEAKDADEAQKLIVEHKPHLIFLDINMPGKDVFEMLNGLKYSPQVIFVTAYDKYAVKAFEASALAYLLKPLNPEKLRKAIEKVVEKTTILEPTTRVYLKEGDNYHLILLEDILMVESVLEKTTIHLKDKSISTKNTLNYFEQKLPEQLFFKVNRNQLINLSFIKNIKSHDKDNLTITLVNNLSVETSQRQTTKFKEIYDL